MNKKETLKTVKTLLNYGNTVIISNGYNPITLWLDETCKYIMYKRYGQSAIKNNMKELTWLVNTYLDKNMSINYKIV